ncbi:hypothetical protein [Mycobacteroides abscessus]|uniref:hypothetical protein n=1 Tax=Mycobacteroides abscessus TaxID=36809 RepID=UPI0009A8F4F4|nr:hypothetical protein [Mycobacteroides abscessus]RIR04087.1 hypothetical protein D2E35_07185 [Mycobacteroides abscessus]SKQ50215.1 Uncharacterised protein [Mycobacteroides abscessus subsp. massiliense]SLB51226.1 Uncharacterised protein [Mycobacteroides abscessus subsp. massiliense]
MRIVFRFTQSARKHRIGRAHVKAAMGNAVLVEIREDARGAMGMFIGTDDRGIDLEIGIKGADDVWDGQHAVWLVIHVMPYRFRK